MTRFTRRPAFHALVIASAYLVFGVAYINVSGRIVETLASSAQEVHRLEELKGQAYMAVTAVGLFLITLWVLRRYRSLFEAAARERELLALTQQRALASELAAAVAHDFRNLLMVVAHALDEVGDNQLLAEREEALADARQACKRGADLATRLLEASRGKASQSRSHGPLAPQIGEILDMLRLSERVRHCIVQRQLDPSVMMTSDTVLMAQVVLNLVLNAADATAGRGRILVRVVAMTDEAVLEVHDDGPGVPEPLREGLFEPFRTSKPDGWGVGLLAVRLGVQAHQGTLELIDSELGGACFRARFPAVGCGTSK
jgi:signal transduction histidine kinase